MGKIEIKSIGVAEEDIVDRQKRISWWRQEVVQDARILVIGAGAIGNEVLKNLALIGVGHILICDMDTISTSNLSRTVLFAKEDVGKYKAEVARQRVKEMSVCPEVKVDCFVGDIIHLLGNGIFRQFDLVLGCLDNIETRVSVNKRCNLLQIPYFDGGISELALSLQQFHYPESSCFYCGLSTRALAQEKLTRYSCDMKRMKAVAEGRVATSQISTAIVGALEVQEAVKYIHNKESVSFGRKYFFEGMNNYFESIRINPKEDCPYHESYGEVIETDWSSQVTLQEFLSWVSSQNGGKEYFLDLAGEDYRFTISGQCMECGKKMEFFKPDYLTYYEDFICEDCQGKAGKKGNHTTRSVEVETFRLGDVRFDGMSLEALGIPKGHIVTVRNVEDSKDCRYYELTGDIVAVIPEVGVCHAK